MRVLVAAVAVLAAPVLSAAAPADAGSSSEPLAVTVAVDGQPTDGRAVPIDPDQPVSLVITATNKGDSEQRVRTVRLSGDVLGLSFFSYDTMVPFSVPAHDSATRTLVLDLGDLRGQTIGLMPASVRLLDIADTSLGSADTVTDVRGSIVSLFGAFGLVLLVFTAAAWVSGLRAVSRRRRQDGRAKWVARFLPAGIGTGMLAVVWLSVFRVLAPEPLPALGVILGGAVLGVLAAGTVARPEPELEPLTAIIDPTVGVKTGVLDPEPGDATQIVAKTVVDDDEDGDDQSHGRRSGRIDDERDDSPHDSPEDSSDKTAEAGEEDAVPESEEHLEREESTR